MSMRTEELAATLARYLVRGVLVDTDDTAEYFQRLEVRGLAGQSHPDVHHLQPYGLYSVPEAGAQVALFEVGGSQDHVVALAVTDERYRPKNGEGGETGLHGKGFTAVRARPNGDVEIEGGAGTVRIKITAAGEVTIEGKIFLEHTHSKPIGCQGAASTGDVD